MIKLLKFIVIVHCLSWLSLVGIPSHDLRTCAPNKPCLSQCTGATGCKQPKHHTGATSAIICSPCVSSRNGNSAQLSPTTLVNTWLLNQMSNQLCGIYNVLSFDSAYHGGLTLFNQGGPYHNNTDACGHCLHPPLDYWDYPLIITDSDPCFQNINVVKFQQDIVFKPKTSCPLSATDPIAAIVIAKNNMTIDLSGFTLQFDDSLSSPGYNPTVCGYASGCPSSGCVATMHGIYIMPGVTNTQIVSSTYQNSSTYGTIKGFTGYGIYAVGSSSTPGQGLQDLTIQNIHINQCFSGILCQNATNVKILHTEANENCCFNTVYGMQFAEVVNLAIIDSQASGNSSCSFVYGIYAVDTINMLIKDSHTNHNQSFTGSAAGIYLGSTGIAAENIIKHCTVNSNIGTASIGNATAGIWLDTNTVHTIVEDCTVLNNNAPGSSFVAGIYVNNSNDNYITKNHVGQNGGIGIFDTLASSTSLYTLNVSFFNGPNGITNYYVFYNINAGGQSRALDATIIYASDLKAANTINIPLGNLDIRKSQT